MRILNAILLDFLQRRLGGRSAPALHLVERRRIGWHFEKQSLDQTLFQHELVLMRFIIMHHVTFADVIQQAFLQQMLLIAITD